MRGAFSVSTEDMMTVGPGDDLMTVVCRPVVSGKVGAGTC